jgi:hypothetical protein
MFQVCFLFHYKGMLGKEKDWSEAERLWTRGSLGWAWWFGSDTVAHGCNPCYSGVRSRRIAVPGQESERHCGNQNKGKRTGGWLKWWSTWLVSVKLWVQFPVLQRGSLGRRWKGGDETFCFEVPVSLMGQHSPNCNFVLSWKTIHAGVQWMPSEFYC